MICIIIFFLFGFFLGNILYASWKWNHGICRENGLPWRAFDVDSHGETGYEAGNEIWWNGWPTFNIFKKKFYIEKTKK